MLLFLGVWALWVLSCVSFPRHQFKERKCRKWNSLSHVRLFATPWTVAYQSPQSMEFSRQEYWSGLPFPSPGDLPNLGIKPGSPALQADALLSEPPGSPFKGGWTEKQEGGKMEGIQEKALAILLSDHSSGTQSFREPSNSKKNNIQTSATWPHQISWSQ